MRKLLLLISLFPFYINAQINTDSLWGIWNDHNNSDSIRFLSLTRLCWRGFMFSNTDSAFKIATIHYNFAYSKNDILQMSIARNSQGVASAIQGDNDEALKYFEECVDLNSKIEDESQVASTASTLNNIGLIYKKKGNYNKAIDYYLQSLNIREKVNDTSGVISSLNNISTIYLEMGEDEKAKEVINRCLKVVDLHEDTRSAAIAFNNLGMVYERQKKIRKAIKAFKQSIQLFKKTNSLRDIALITSNVGVMYRDLEEIDSAFYYIHQASDIGKEINDPEVIASTDFNLAILYIDSSPSKAIVLGEKARDISIQIHSIQTQKESAEVLWRAYRNKKNYKKSLEMYEEYIMLRDSLNSEENQKEVIRQEYKYEYEKQAALDSIKAAENSKTQEAEIAKKNIEIASKEKEQYMLYSGLGLVILFSLFIFNRFKITNKQKSIIENQKHLVEEKNKEILDSINYAKRIQTAILPPQKMIKNYLPDSFILYKPKDIVAGDFYWLEPIDSPTKEVLFAVADCTGHGVPGAMVSVICNNGLNRSVREQGLSEPGKILDKTREVVIAEFEKSEEEVKDGMDIAICNLKQLDNNYRLQYAGAHNPLWIVKKGSSEVKEIKANKQPIGKYEDQKPYTTHELELNEGDTIYIFSDGFADQFGGDKGKKFKSANFKHLLLSIQDQPMEKQKTLIDNAFEDWKNNIEQVDDVCIMGVRV